MLVFVVILPNCRFLRFCTTSLATGTPPWLLSVALFLPDFSVTVLQLALRFWPGAFYREVLFTLHSFPRLAKWLSLAILAKSLSVRLQTKWFLVRVLLQPPNLQILRLLQAGSSLTFRRLQSVDSLWNAYVTWQEHTVNTFPTYRHVFAKQMRTGTPYPRSFSVAAFTKLSFPADERSWTTHIVDTRPLVYQLCQWATKYKVTSLLHNIFQPTYASSKSYEKDHKQDLLISTD